MARKSPAIEPSGFTILVIDDQAEVLSSTCGVLERNGHHILTAQSGEEALAILRSSQVQLIIVDYLMPGMDGETVIRHIREKDTEVQILLQTGSAGEVPPQEMLHRLNIQGYHAKTDRPERLRLWVDVALKSYLQLQKAREIERLKSYLSQQEQQLDTLEELVAARTAELAQANRELAQTVEELQHANASAQAANQAKSVFLDTMSHGMRPPLNGVVSTAELLLPASNPVPACLSGCSTPPAS